MTILRASGTPQMADGPGFYTTRWDVNCHRLWVPRRLHTDLRVGPLHQARTVAARLGASPGMTAPNDIWDVNRLEINGETDHLARVIAMQTYGKHAGADPELGPTPLCGRLMAGDALRSFPERPRRLGRSQAEQLAWEVDLAWRTRCPSAP